MKMKSCQEKQHEVHDIIPDDDGIGGLVGVHKVEAKLDRKTGQYYISNISIHHKYKTVKIVASSGVLLAHLYMYMQWR